MFQEISLTKLPPGRRHENNRLDVDLALDAAKLNAGR